MLSLQHLDIDIYSYLDSRLLIMDYCNRCKAKDNRYSLRWFAKKLEFGAPNYIKLIIDGERNISEKRLEKFSSLMGLKGVESEYFELLVRMTQTSDIDRRDHYFQKLSAIRRKKLKVHKLEGAQFDCLSSWLHLLIREMTFLKKFSSDSQWINKNLMYKVSPNEIIKCIGDLETAGLLAREQEQLKAVDSSITFPDEVRSLAIQKYHQGILGQASIALQQSLEQREYGAALVATTPEKFKLVKEKMKNFRAEILELLDTENGEAEDVVVLAFQLFHVVEGSRDNEND
ncbi:MAG: TIGR02147 family protein [SAR324 cluster bacterium]|nr:TIGR02147 family protein [SAR324 cluster bacterium]